MASCPERFVREGQCVGVYRLDHLPSGYVYVGSSCDLVARRANWRGKLDKYFARRAFYDGRAKPWKLLGWSEKFHKRVSRLSRDGWYFVEVRLFPVGAPLSDVFAAEVAEIERWAALDAALVLNASLDGGTAGYLYERDWRVSSYAWRRSASSCAAVS